VLNLFWIFLLYAPHVKQGSIPDRGCFYAREAGGGVVEEMGVMGVMEEWKSRVKGEWSILVTNEGSKSFFFSLFPRFVHFFNVAKDKGETKKNESKKSVFTIGIDNLLGAETLVGGGGGVALERVTDIACCGVNRDFTVLKERNEWGAGGLVTCQGFFWLLLLLLCRGVWEKGDEGEEGEEEC
jgi:hypothetical protein